MKPVIIVVIIAAILISVIGSFIAYRSRFSEDMEKNTSPTRQPRTLLQSFTLELEFGGNITNLSNEPINVNETDLLVYDYPLNTSTQEVIYTELYYNGEQIPYRIETEGNDSYVVYPDINVTDILYPDQTASSKVVYRVRVNVAERLSQIEGLSFENAGSWNDIPGGEVEKYTNSTSLWNYTNPLVRLLYRYIMRKHSETPLHYLAYTLNWVDSMVSYETRIPPRAPWEVILRRKGDCDEQSNLVITLLRAAGIPSFLETGIVYIPGFNHKSTEANGLFTYEFINGGAHGWLVTYIPPWGYVRVDLTMAKGKPGDLESMLNHIRNAVYYNSYFVTIVTSRIVSKNYVEQSIEFIKEIKEEKLKYDVYIRVELISARG